MMTPAMAFVSTIHSSFLGSQLSSSLCSGRAVTSSHSKPRSRAAHVVFCELADVVASTGASGDGSSQISDTPADLSSTNEISSPGSVEETSGAYVDEPEVAESIGEPTVSDQVTEAIAEDVQNEVDSVSKNEGKRRRSKHRPQREVTLKLEDMFVGQELEGTVKSTTVYGAFIGGMGTATDGLLHVSQMSNSFVENVTDVVNVGEKIKVRILSVDLEKGNFSLTMKPPREFQDTMDSEDRGSDVEGSDGGATAARQGRKHNRVSLSQKWTDFQFDPSKFVDVKVVSVTNFGAFCKFLDEEGNEDPTIPTDGLVHISEISEGRVDNIQEAITVGDVVKARVISVDRTRSRISLSLREERPEEKDSLKENLAANLANQPSFKTTFELAFEKARGISGN